MDGNKICKKCNIKHPANYKKCAFCHGVLEPLNLKKDQAYDRTHADPIRGGGEASGAAAADTAVASGGVM